MYIMDMNCKGVAHIDTCTITELIYEVGGRADA